MTKRQFIALATVLEDFRSRMALQDHWDLVEAIGDVCAATNP